MASILSGKFLKVDAKAPKAAAEGKESEDAQKQKKGRSSRLNPLLNSRTADYVDDLDLYVPRISRAERYQYWQQLTKNNRPRRLPTHFRSWVQKQVDAVNERDTFPTSSLRFFGAVKSSFWDQLYLSLFVLWWLLIVFYGDGWASKFAPPMATSLNENNAILLLPPVLMFVSQLIPLVGTLYSINYCNDMVRFLATSEITSWVSVSYIMCHPSIYPSINALRAIYPLIHYVPSFHLSIHPSSIMCHHSIYPSIHQCIPNP